MADEIIDGGIAGTLKEAQIRQRKLAEDYLNDPPRPLLEELAAKDARIKELENEVLCISRDRDSWAEESRKNKIALIKTENRIAELTAVYLGVCSQVKERDERIEALEAANARLQSANDVLDDCIAADRIRLAAADEMARALDELINAVKAVPVMNNQKYDALGVYVNAALARYRAAGGGK